jgi:branched-chain amino acid transport system ATP-binding protein
MALLETRGLTKTFGSVTAADNISVSIEAQEVIGIIGANGAGKTTFVNMVTGYQKPSSGSIWYRGQDITPHGPRQITRLGICRSFQVPQVFPSLSLFDNLLISLGVAEGERPAIWRPLRRPHLHAAAEEIVARYDLASYGGQLVALLPQGVRKLLDIAMAMAHRPQLILLDEPTSGVSVGEKFGIMDVVMGALRDTGVTVLFIEHDMEIIERYGSRVVAFAEGTILADGAPRDVLADEQVRRYVIGEALHRSSHARGGAPHA